MQRGRMNKTALTSLSKRIVKTINTSRKIPAEINAATPTVFSGSMARKVLEPLPVK